MEDEGFIRGAILSLSRDFKNFRTKNMLKLLEASIKISDYERINK